VKRSNVWLHVAVCLLLCTVSLAHGQAGSLRFPESRSYSPGKIWLEWTPAERTGFVRRFIMGHDQGYQSGCRSGETSHVSPKRADSSLDPCLQQRHLFGRDVAFYEQFITDFYSRYSTDRDVPFRVLLLQADEKNPDEVHQWLDKKSN
jgi:hypothetical protein